MYTLYSIPGSCSTGITVLLKKLDVPFTVLTRDETPHYKEIVPTNQVPALKIGDQVITEGAAIVLYLLEKHGADMLPSDLNQKAEFMQWLMFNYATLHPAYSKIFGINAVAHDAANKAEIKQRAADALSNTWKIVDDRLATQKYIFGDTPTILDYLVTIYTSWNNYFPDLTITYGDNVQRLVNDIIELPEFKQAYDFEKTTFKHAA